MHLLCWQQICAYEALQSIRTWTDLKKRVSPSRRCFAFTHRCLPREPVLVVHIALTQQISDNIQACASSWNSKQNYITSISLVKRSFFSEISLWWNCEYSKLICGFGFQLQCLLGDHVPHVSQSTSDSTLENLASDGIVQNAKTAIFYSITSTQKGSFHKFVYFNQLALSPSLLFFSLG